MSNELTIVFLGTGASQGVPYLGCKSEVCLSDNPKDKRTRTSAMIKYKGKSILIDCGPDFRTQMLREGLDDVDAVLFTHEHNDHIAGIDDLRPINYVQNKDIPIYGQERVLNAIKERYYYSFGVNKYPGSVSLELMPIDRTFTLFDEISVRPIEVSHGELDIYGYKIDDKLAYITDASYIRESEIDAIKGVDILVINTLREETHPSHFSLSEAISLSKKISPQKTYLVHMGDAMGLHNSIQEELPDSIYLAFDGLAVKV